MRVLTAALFSPTTNRWLLFWAYRRKLSQNPATKRTAFLLGTKMERRTYYRVARSFVFAEGLPWLTKKDSISYEQPMQFNSGVRIGQTRDQIRLYLDKKAPSSSSQDATSSYNPRKRDRSRQESIFSKSQAPGAQ